MIIQPAQTVGGSDGGLVRRMALRQVRDRMKAITFGRGDKMSCGECELRKLSNVRQFATWTGMRDHLITFHGLDRREVPE